MPSPLALALVVGAGPGLGLALGRRFAREGLAVALVCRAEDPAERFEMALLEAGAPEAWALPADLGDPASLERALARIQERLGFPELLVYNAASGARGPAVDLEPEALRRAFQVNVLSLLACVRWVQPAMRAAGRGTLLVTGGGLALEPKPGEGGPALGKAAQRSLARSLARELASEGIHAATVTVAGFLQAGGSFSPEAAAEAFWQLHREPREAWREEWTLTPSQ